VSGALCYVGAGMDDIPLLHDLYAALSGALPRALRGYLDPTLAVLGATVLAIVARLTVFRWLRRRSRATANPYDGIIIDVLAGRVIVWTILGSAYLALEDLPWRPRSIAAGQDVIAALLILSVTLALVRMTSAIVVAYGHTRAAGVGGTTLIRYVATTVMLFIGCVSVLALFGISIVPAITALGVGGLAVALAFQDTLANVFSGLNLSLARQIRVGDYIELAGGEADKIDGFVVDIGWRATTLRTLLGLQVFIPNKKLAERIMINYTRDPGMSVELQFRVGLDCDPARIEAIVADEMTQAAAALPGLRPDEAALVRFKAFGQWALEFKVFVPIVNFQDRFYLHHELMKRLHRRLQAEQIAVPMQRVQLEAPADSPTTRPV
jgi:small-conductance mechanosensitive channel